uniref:VWFA domain-containing protein n=1 Tax=Parascaris univalens TaxID=6257 RepID=A0A915AQK3_PARUN
MSEQRRDLSKWEYLIFSIKSKNSSLRKWPIAKSRTTLLATLALVVILSIISITLIYTFLPGSPTSATINDENPHITQLNTIAFGIAQFKSLTSRQTPPSSNKGTIIKGVIEKLSSDATGFAFEVDNGEDAKIHQYANSTAAIAALDSLLQNVVGRNPNQTNAVAAYLRALPNDQQCLMVQRTYTFFAAVPDDYASYEDFFNDMRTAVQELSALRDVDKEIKAILISTADMTNITGDSDICIVTDVGADNDHMVDAIANYIALATALCPTKTTTMASSTLTSIPPSIFTASTATETSTTETESSITSAASSGYTTVTLTTSATTAKPSSTPDAETTTSDLTVPSTTTATDGKTESPPLPSPHCFGDFIFVIDGSTDISQSVRIYS